MDPTIEMDQCVKPMKGFNDGLKDDHEREGMEDVERSESSVSSEEGATSEDAPTE